MDPTIEVLTIYPAAWAALFQGLAEGLIFGLVGVATIAIGVTVMIVSVGSLSDCCRTGGPDSGLAQPATDELPAVINLATVRQARQQGRRRLG